MRREEKEVAFQDGTYSFKTINILDIHKNILQEKFSQIFQTKYMQIKRSEVIESSVDIGQLINISCIAPPRDYLVKLFKLRVYKYIK